jgi:hypothetical protein
MPFRHTFPIVALMALTQAPIDAYAQKVPDSVVPPTGAELSPAEFAANCREAAIAQSASVRPDTDFYAAMMERATFWTARLEILESDQGRRDAIMAQAHSVMLGRLRQTGSRMEGMVFVGTVLAECREARAQLAPEQ